MKLKTVQQQASFAAPLFHLDAEQAVGSRDLLRWGNPLLDELLKSASAGTWTLDIDRQRLYWRSFDYASGFTCEDASCTVVEFLDGLHEADRERVANALSECVESGSDLDIEYRSTWPDGKLHDLIDRGVVYRDQSGCVSHVAGVFWDVTERRQRDAALKYRLDLADLITSLTKTFITIPADLIDNGIRQVLSRIGNYVRADRSYVMQLTEQKTALAVAHHWHCQGSRLSNVEQTLPVNRLPTIVRGVLDLDVLALPKIAQLASGDRTQLEQFSGRNIGAMVAVPIVSGDGLKGMLVFESTDQRPNWNADLSSVFEVVGDLLGNALERSERERQLEDYHSNLERKIGQLVITRDGADAIAATSSSEWRQMAPPPAKKDNAQDARIVSLIESALAADLFEMEAQPIVPVGRSVDRVRLELLLRLRDAEGKIIPAGELMAVAERRALANRIDSWVVEHVIKSLAEQPDTREEIGINLSGQSVGDPAFLAHVVQLLDEYSVATNKICFELTETAAIQNLFRATRFMSILKGLGCQFAIDDFGSGLSSYAYLKYLPVDFLKIDGIFIREVSTNPSDAAIVRSINEIAHSLGKQTIAECVEDPASIDVLKDIGVDFVQGFGVGTNRPFDLN